MTTSITHESTIEEKVNLAKTLARNLNESEYSKSQKLIDEMKKNASAIIIPDIDDSSAVNAKTDVFQSSNEQDEILKMSIDELFTEFGEDLNFVNGDED